MKKRNLGKALFLCVLVIMVAGIGVAIVASVEKEDDRNKEVEQQVQQTDKEEEQQENAGEQQDNEDEQQQAGGETPFDMTNPIPDENYTAIVSYQAKQELQSEDQLYKAEVTVTMPQLTMRTAAAGAINEKLLAFYTEAYEQGISSSGQDMECQKEAAAELEDYFYYNYTYEMGYQVTLLDDNYLSILANGYEYAGGAHGMPFRTELIFNMETGEQVMGESLFDLSEEEFQKIKIEAYRNLIEHSEEGEYWQDALSIVEKDMDFDSGYYLTEEGVTFYYHPYMLAPYAAGYVEVTVPYAELPLL